MKLNEKVITVLMVLIIVLSFFTGCATKAFNTRIGPNTFSLRVHQGTFDVTGDAYNLWNKEAQALCSRIGYETFETTERQYNIDREHLIGVIKCK